MSKDEMQTAESSEMAVTSIWEKETETARHLSLYKAAVNGDWAVIRECLENGTANSRISMYYDNVIHVIVSKRNVKDTSFLRELMNHPRLDPNLILQTNNQGCTTLLSAATAGNIEAAMILVEKNPALLTIPDSGGNLPVYVAALNAHKETIRYLIDETAKRPDHNFNGPYGVWLINILITEGLYGIALSLLDTFPELAHGSDIDNNTPLVTLAKNPLAFHNGNNEQGKVLELTRRICQHMLEYTLRPEINMNATAFFFGPLFLAAKHGIHHIAVEIITAVPYIIWLGDDHGRTIYHYAVLNRHEKLFKLVWDLGSNKNKISVIKENDGNNILHLAAKLGATTTSRVTGAALQMQRELQWYKEVEKLMRSSYKEDLNANGMTPRMLFTEEHKDLVKEGEEWMKTTASSCTVVAALILTVVFAAAFTVAGGNNSEGIPIFLHNPYFIVFAISNAIGFFSSSTSLMMFLGILNSRFSEIDFLHSLPSKMIIGLCTLFLSILCMLIAFCTTLNIYFTHLSRFALIPLILCTCVPAIFFMRLQFPLLYEMWYSTYGPSIFRPDTINMSPTNLRQPPPLGPVLVAPPAAPSDV